MDGIADRRKRRGAQPDTENESQDAEAAVPAVAHDRELRLAVMAAAEAVGGVGEPVLMECAGQPNGGEEREPCREGAAAADQLRDQEDQRGEAADPGADQRERPARRGDGALFARHLDADRQAGQHRGGDGEFFERAAPRIHAQDDKRFRR